MVGCVRSSNQNCIYVRTSAQFFCRSERREECCTEPKPLELFGDRDVRAQLLYSFSPAQIRALIAEQHAIQSLQYQSES